MNFLTDIANIKHTEDFFGPCVIKHGHLIDFDEAIARSSMYKPFERATHEATCNLFAKEVN